MAYQTLTSEFNNEDRADDAIGRLEVLGVPSANITKSLTARDQIAVSAEVEDRLTEKASEILNG